MSKRKIAVEDLSFLGNDEESIKEIKQHIEEYTEYNIKKIQKLTGERDIEIIGDIPSNTAIIMEAKRVEDGKTIYAKLEINGNIKEKAVILSQGAIEISNGKAGSCVIEKGAIVIAQNNSSIRVEGRVKETVVIETRGAFKAIAVNDGAIICVPEGNIDITHDKRQKPEASGHNSEYIPYVKNIHFGKTYTHNDSDHNFKMPEMSNNEYHIYNSKIKRACEDKPPQDSYYIEEGENKRKVSKEEFIRITGQSPEQISEFSKHVPKPKYYFHDNKQSQSSNVEGASAQPHQKHDRKK